MPAKDWFPEEERTRDAILNWLEFPPWMNHKVTSHAVGNVAHPGFVSFNAIGECFLVTVNRITDHSAMVAIEDEKARGTDT
jgi:hypothetical protein